MIKELSILTPNENLMINLDLNPETFEAWEEEWKESNPGTSEPKRYHEFYDEVISSISEFFKLEQFVHHDYDTTTPLYFSRCDEKIEQYWRAENEDVIVWDFEGNLFKHRYTITFQPKTIKGMYLITLFLNAAYNQEWFYEVNSDENFTDSKG